MADVSQLPLQRAGGRGLREVLDDLVRGEVDFERITVALGEQVRAHPVRTLAIAAMGGLFVGKLLRRG
jgi:ElaB/YqjD/DUF883 family membrane-anchored ribosome-binding protein